MATCNADRFQSLIGQSREVLTRMTFTNPVRVEEPGMMMTMDFRADRMRIILDERGTITAVRCG
jgi:hypothetical protein